MKAPTEVLTTTNYELFKTIKGNRVKNENHLRRLVKSMKEEYIPIPILVNSKNEVIDGQHRLAACKELGLPISYIRGNGYGLKEVQKLNSLSKTWNGFDQAQSRALAGNENYQIYIEFKEKYKFGQQETMLLLSMGKHGDNETNKFKEGLFEVKNVAWARSSADKLYQIGQYYKGFKRRSFVLAMIALFNNKLYDHKQFIDKLKYNSQQMVDCTNTEQYTLLIERIFNYRNQNKVRF